jgi:hypothetical protein
MSSPFVFPRHTSGVCPVSVGQGIVVHLGAFGIVIGHIVCAIKFKRFFLLR